MKKNYATFEKQFKLLQMDKVSRQYSSKSLEIGNLRDITLWQISS